MYLPQRNSRMYGAFICLLFLTFFFRSSYSLAGFSIPFSGWERKSNNKWIRNKRVGATETANIEKRKKKNPEPFKGNTQTQRSIFHAMFW